MAALTTGTKRNVVTPDTVLGGFVIRLDIEASATIYKGAFVEVGTNGVQPCAGTDGVACLGMALETVNNSTGSAGDKQVDILFGMVIRIAAASVTGMTGVIADLGKRVYASSDNDLTTTATNNNFGVTIGLDGTDLLILHDPNLATA